MTTILTLKMDDASQASFEALRQQYYPVELNRIAAHLTLFHTLPATDEVRAWLQQECAVLPSFAMQVTGLRSLGRGVAFRLESAELGALQRRLAGRFAEHLSAQDRQRIQPHVVVQNKVSGAEAKALLGRIERGFRAVCGGGCGIGVVGLPGWAVAIAGAVQLPWDLAVGDESAVFIEVRGLRF